MRTQIKANGKLLYDSALPPESGYCIHAGKISERVNKAGSLALTVPRGNPRCGDITPLTTLIEVFRDGRLRWRGRALVPGTDLYGRKTIICEGELCFFQDSAQRPRIIVGTPAELFADVIHAHNARVESWKRFSVGVVTVEVPAGVLSLEITEGKKSHAILMGLLAICGGYLLIDDGDDGTRRINWYAQLPHMCSQPVRAGYNLTDFSSAGDVTNFATRIVPYGAELEEGKRLTLDRGGVDYVDAPDAVALHGIVEASVVYSGATTPEELEQAALEDLLWRCVIPETFALSAVDMARQDLRVESFAMGQRVRGESSFHGLSGVYDLLALEEDLLDPGGNKVTLARDAAYAGGAGGTISGAVSDQQTQLNNSRLKMPGGWIGYLTGSNGKDITTGIGMVNERGVCYMIVTWAGVRLQAGETRLYLTEDNGQIVLVGHTVLRGPVSIEGDVDIKGSLTLNGVEITPEVTE